MKYLRLDLIIIERDNTEILNQYSEMDAAAFRISPILVQFYVLSYRTNITQIQNINNSLFRENRITWPVTFSPEDISSSQVHAKNCVRYLHRLTLH